MRTNEELIALLPVTVDGVPVIPEIDYVYYPEDCLQPNPDTVYIHLVRRIVKRRWFGGKRSGRLGEFVTKPQQMSEYRQASVSSCYFDYQKAYEAYNTRKQNVGTN